MKTVTEYMRSPLFRDAFIHDDRTGTDTVIRYHDDCEDIVMRSQEECKEEREADRDLILAACG